MTRPLVLDSSALTALFEAHDPVYRLWTRADRGDLLLVVPSGAIVEANNELKASADAWASVLWPVNVVGLPLTPEAAIEVGPWSGEIGVRHVTYEAMAVRGVVVTRRPYDYTGRPVPVLVV